ncbi:MAG: amidase [Alphaproteobacteria bacterium]|nr:amidase [Alphaproteobacteria bacterium]
MTTDLVHLAATELIALYRNKKASPVEAASAALAQIARHEDLNCFCLVDEEAALAAARAAEKRWHEGAPAGRVDGVPTTIKDLAITRGWPTLRGSKTTDQAGPWDEDAPFVASLRDEGAVLLGKTTTPEFGWKGVTDSPLSGITRNPWNKERTPGGSSGGAAAACASYMAPLHQGSDAGGSVRIPSAFCGVFGLKPTYGIIPNYPLPAHIGPLANTGAIARTVDDAALMLTVMAARADPRDATTAPVQGMDFTNGINDGIKGLKIAFSPSFGGSVSVDASVAAATAKAAEILASLGAHVEEADPPLAEARAIFDVLWEPAMTWVIGQMPPEKRAQMDPGLVKLAKLGEHYSARDLVDAQAAMRAMAVAMSRFHETYDLLITPQVPLEAFAAGIDTPLEKDGSWLDWSPFTYPFNMTMQPAAAVPIGLGANGLPVSLQIVGRRFEDGLVLRAAKAYEDMHPFLMPDGY